MIKLLDGYYAQVDSMNYTLSKRMVSENTGKEYYQAVSYHGSLEHLLSGLYDRLGKERLSAREQLTLHEAIEILLKAKEEVKAIAKGTEKKITKEELAETEDKPKKKKK